MVISLVAAQICLYKVYTWGRGNNYKMIFKTQMNVSMEV